MSQETAAVNAGLLPNALMQKLQEHQEGLNIIECNETRLKRRLMDLSGELRSGFADDETAFGSFCNSWN